MELPKFVDETEFESFVFALKSTPCPGCRKIGTLNRHGFLRRATPKKQSDTIKARRIFCSNRFNRNGCGKTFSVYLSMCFKSLQITAKSAWLFLLSILEGMSIEKAYYSHEPCLCLSLSAFFRFWIRFKNSQDSLRTALILTGINASRSFSDPVRETIYHFSLIFFHPEKTPIELFQETLQKSSFEYLYQPHHQNLVVVFTRKILFLSGNRKR